MLHSPQVAQCLTSGQEDTRIFFWIWGPVFLQEQVVFSIVKELLPFCLDRNHHVFWFWFDLPLGHWVHFTWVYQIWSNPSPADKSDLQPRAVDFYRGSHCKALTFGCCKMYCQLCRGWKRTRFLTSELSLVFWRGGRGKEAEMLFCFFFFFFPCSLGRV